MRTADTVTIGESVGGNSVSEISALSRVGRSEVSGSLRVFSPEVGATSGPGAFELRICGGSHLLNLINGHATENLYETFDLCAIML